MPLLRNDDISCSLTWTLPGASASPASSPVLVRVIPAGASDLTSLRPHSCKGPQNHKLTMTLWTASIVNVARFLIACATICSLHRGIYIEPEGESLVTLDLRVWMWWEPFQDIIPLWNRSLVEYLKFQDYLGVLMARCNNLTTSVYSCSHVPDDKHSSEMLTSVASQQFWPYA